MTSLSSAVAMALETNKTSNKNMPDWEKGRLDKRIGQRKIRDEGKDMTAGRSLSEKWMSCRRGGPEFLCCAPYEPSLGWDRRLPPPASLWTALDMALREYTAGDGGWQAEWGVSMGEFLSDFNTTGPGPRQEQIIRRRKPASKPLTVKYHVALIETSLFRPTACGSMQLPLSLRIILARSS